MYRLFVAAPIPDNIKEKLLDLHLNIPGAKWTSGDQLHITLKFIGEVDGDLFKDIRSSLLEIKAHKFLLGIKGVGHFPPGSSPKVLWAGLNDKVPLIKLKNEIENTLEECNIKRESRKFSPHITLARLKNTHINRVKEFLSVYSTLRMEDFNVDEFRLYSSKLYSRGAVHNIEAVYPLY